MPTATLNSHQHVEEASVQRVGTVPVSAATGLVHEMVTTRGDFDALEADWVRLTERSGRDTYVFQGFNWLWHWCNHYLAADNKRHGPKLAIVVSRRGGRVVAIWPLVLERRSRLSQLSWMGEPASQYGDVLVDSDVDSMDVIRDGWAYIATMVRPDVVHLRKVRADAAVAPLLAEIGARETARAAAPYLDLASAPSAEAYEDRYPARARKNRRRLRRRLAERGEITVAVHGSGDAARAVAELAVRFKRAWLRDRGLISPAIADDRMLRFLTDAARGATRPTGCRVSVLTSAREPASIEIGFVCKGRLALHMIAYNLKFERSGAGVLHLEDTIRRCYEDGVTTCDMLAPMSPYKMDWADGAVPVIDHAIGLNAAGRAYVNLYLALVRNRMKRAVEALPAGLRRWLASSQAMVAALLGA